MTINVISKILIEDATCVLGATANLLLHGSYKWKNTKEFCPVLSVLCYHNEPETGEDCRQGRQISLNII